MSKLVQRGASCALRMRQMSSATKDVSPEKAVEFGRKLNPAQTIYGPKDPNVEKWQKFFQDPLNAERPIYRRKGFSDDAIVFVISGTVCGLFVYNMVDFFQNF